MKSIDGIIPHIKHRWLSTAPTRGWFDDKLHKAFLIVAENNEPIVLSEDIEEPDDRLWAEWFEDFNNDGVITL